ncbi:hypothetical protein HMPREF3040_05055 [Escherichia coli]|nr:hypothetical protein EC2720900_0549 [Escherichia coli 2720900]KXG90213.1 hypothetical protein HMPREF3040_05055 [Escherichia coli]
MVPAFPLCHHFPVFIQKRRGRGKLAFSRPRGWTTEQREGVSGFL